jgi:hypothetical protein
MEKKENYRRDTKSRFVDADVVGPMCEIISIRGAEPSPRASVPASFFSGGILTIWKQIAVLEREVAVGHAGNVVRRGAMKSISADAVLCFATEVFGIFDQVLEKLGNPASGLVVGLGNFGAAVEVLKQMTPEGREFLSSRLAERGKTRRVVAEVLEGLNLGLTEICRGLANEVIHQEVHQAPNHKSPIAWDIKIGVSPPRGILGAFPEWHLIQRGECEQAGIEPIVEVMAGVGDLIGQIRDLRFERR